VALPALGNGDGLARLDDLRAGGSVSTSKACVPPSVTFCTFGLLKMAPAMSARLIFAGRALSSADAQSAAVHSAIRYQPTASPSLR
jgi:hypothetical protein